MVGVLFSDFVLLFYHLWAGAEARILIALGESAFRD